MKMLWDFSILSSDYMLDVTGQPVWQHTLDKCRKLDFTSQYIVVGIVMVNYLL